MILILTIEFCICHIEAANEGGPRYNQTQTDKERADYSNFIILCPNCHWEIDINPQRYTVEHLYKIKKQHEEKFQGKPYHLPEDILSLMRVSINEDEFSLEQISLLLDIFNEIKNNETKQYFFEKRILYALNNLILNDIEKDSASEFELKKILARISPFGDHEFIQIILKINQQLQSKFILTEFLNINKNRIILILDKILSNQIKEPYDNVFYLINKSDINTVNHLISNAAKYSYDIFKDLVINLDLNEIDLEDKLSLEKNIWNLLDSIHDKGNSEYRNLLDLETKIFNSLQNNRKSVLSQNISSIKTDNNIE